MMDFWHYRTVWDEMVKNECTTNRLKMMARKAGPESFYEKFIPDARKKHEANPDDTDTTWHFARMIAEGFWIGYQRPYFKLWPALLDKMMDTELKVSCTHFLPPFPGYTVLLPRVGIPRISDPFRDKPSVQPKALIVACTKGHTKKDERWVTVLIQNDHGEGGRAFILEDDKTIEDQLEYIEAHLEDEEPLTPAQQLVHRRVVRAALGTAFFGVDNHEMILPDIPRKKFVKWHKAIQEGNTAEANRIIQEEAKKNGLGYSAGREIDLPRPIVDHKYFDRQPTKLGRELKYSHFKSGHLKMQACGEGLRDRKLIFVSPYQVRKDLALDPKARGYRVGREYDEQQRKMG